MIVLFINAITQNKCELDMTMEVTGIFLDWIMCSMSSPFFKFHSETFPDSVPVTARSPSLDMANAFMNLLGSLKLFLRKKFFFLMLSTNREFFGIFYENNKTKFNIHYLKNSWKVKIETNPWRGKQKTSIFGNFQVIYAWCLLDEYCNQISC